MNIHSQEEVGRWVQGFIEENRLDKFYTSGYWQNLRNEVLEEHKKECQVCKKKGFYAEANHVHHVQYVRKHPRLALSKTYVFEGKEYVNLLPVCKNCHENVCHPERLRHRQKKLLTEEKW